MGKILDLSLKLFTSHYLLNVVIKRTEFLNSPIDIRHSFRLPAEMSNPSSSAFKTDSYRFTLNNDRNFSGSIGVLQHGFKMSGIFYHIKIVHLAAFFGICFTSCPGMGSGIFSKNQDIFRHFSFLPGCKRHT
jgi:hypothetical protein